MTEAVDALAYWQRNHTGTARVIREGHEHRWELAEHIAGHEPINVLEFGSGSGRNLAVLRERLPLAHLVGIDANPQAIIAGREAHKAVTFIEGDQSALAEFRDGAFDVVFTVSVLDHLPGAAWRHVYGELVRVARVAVVLLEPILKADNEYGYVESDCASIGIDTTPFTWVHDYLRNDPGLKIVRPLPLDLRPNHYEFSQLYHLLERVK